MVDELIKQHELSQQRQDYRFGVLASLTANINRDSQKRPEPYTWEDFFPTAEAQQEVQSEEEAYAALKTWSIAHNTRIKQGHGER